MVSTSTLNQPALDRLTPEPPSECGVFYSPVATLKRHLAAIKSDKSLYNEILSTPDTTPGNDKIILYFGDRVRELPLGSTRNNYVSPLFNRSKLNGNKAQLPLIKGFLYNGDRYTNHKGETKKRPSEALVTIDVDDHLRAAKLAEAVKDKFGDSGRVFLSLSASGRYKAHFFVALDKSWWFDAKDIAFRMCKYLGIPVEWVDPCGASKCFLTKSLAHELESRSHYYWEKAELDELMPVEKKASKALPFKPTEDNFKEAEKLVAKHKIGGKRRVPCVRLLALLLAAPTVAYNEQGVVKVVARESAALGLSLSCRAVTDMLNVLEGNGIIKRAYGAMQLTRVTIVGGQVSMTSLEENAERSTVIYYGKYSRQVVDTIRKLGLEKARKGQFNPCEVQAALSALEDGWDLTQLTRVLSSEWKGWSTPKRVKRLGRVWKWAERRLLSSNRAELVKGVVEDKRRTIAV
jgi:hypothetical protein